MNQYAINGISLDEWRARQDEYHQRKARLWELGLPSKELTRRCREIRNELGLK